jgi:hypothetical protein
MTWMIPPREGYMLEFMQKIISIALATNASITSWIRSQKHNKDVGGSEYSLHLAGLAVDLIFDTPADKLLAIHYAERFDLTAIDEGDHLHIQIK